MIGDHMVRRDRDSLLYCASAKKDEKQRCFRWNEGVSKRGADAMLIIL